MLTRLSPLIVLPVVIIAAAAGYSAADRPHGTAATSARPVAATTAAATGPAPSGKLPPNHPPVGASPHGGHGAAGALPANDEPPALGWAVPDGWQARANPSPMRIATYKTGDASEMSVTRAGGSVDANVARWQTQFDGAAKFERTEKQVHGMKVIVVRISGTYLGNGMGSSAESKHDGWEMLAAIAQSSGSPYFFKLTGPADQVESVRGAFDRLVDSVAPRP